MAEQNTKDYLAEINELASKESPSASDVDKVLSLFETAMGENMAKAVNTYAMAEELAKLIAKGHNDLIETAIKQKGQITEADLKSYIGEATKTLAKQTKENSEGYVKKGEKLEDAKKLFLSRETSIYEAETESALTTLKTVIRRSERYIDTEGKSEKQLAAAHREETSSTLHRYHLYLEKADDAPGTFSKSSTRRTYIEEIATLARNTLRPSNDYVAAVEQKLSKVKSAAIEKYQAIGAVSTLLEQTVKNTVAEGEANAFALNTKAYYEALASDTVNNLVSTQKASIGGTLFTDKMANGQTFAQNVLALARNEANQINLEKESYVVASLFADALGTEYTEELLKSAIKAEEEKIRKLGRVAQMNNDITAEFDASIKRYGDYIRIIKNDANFDVDAENNAAAQVLLNYNKVVDAMGDQSSYTVQGLSDFLNGAKVAALIAPVKEDLFDARFAHHVNYLEFVIDHIKGARSHAKSPSALNEALAIDWMVNATSPEFVKKQIQKIVKTSNDTGMKSRLEDTLSVLDDYQEGAASNYAKTAYALKEAGKRKRNELVLGALSQPFMKGIDAASRAKLMARKADMDMPTSTPIHALYAQAQNSGKVMAKVVADLNELSANDEERNGYYKAIIELAEGNDSFVNRMKDYIDVINAHGAETLHNLAQTQDTVKSSFDPNNIESVQEFIASDALTSLPEDVQQLAVNDEIATQILYGLLKENGEDAVAQAESFITLSNLIKTGVTTERAFQATIEKAESKPELAARFSDYVAILNSEDSAEKLTSYAALRHNFYTALNEKDGAALQGIIESYDESKYGASVTNNLFGNENLTSALTIMLADNGNDLVKKSQSLESLSGYANAGEVYASIIEATESENETYRLQQMVAFLGEDRSYSVERYASLDQKVQDLLEAGDVSGLRDLLNSSYIDNSHLSDESVKNIVTQPLDNGKNIPSIILGFKSSDAEELATNLSTVSKYISNEERLENLQKQDPETGLDVFSTLMANKDIYAQAETVITFSSLMGDDHEGRNTILQGYVDRLRNENAENEVIEDTDEIKQFLTMVNIVATTFSDDELETEAKDKQIAKIQGLLAAIKDLETTNDPAALVEFLKSDAYKNGVAEYSIFSPANLLKQYPTSENNAINVMFATTGNDADKEIQFIADVEEIFAGDHITMDFYEDIIRKIDAEDEEKRTRIQTYISSAINGELSTIVNTRSLNVMLSDATAKPSMKKFKAIVESDQFAALSQENRTAFLTAKPEGKEDGLSLAEQIIRLGSKTNEKMAENIQFIGAQIEDANTASQVLSHAASSFDSETALAQYNEYTALYISGETDVLNGLAKVQTTINKAVKDKDIETLQGLIQDETLKALGSDRREQILTKPLIDGKTLLTLLADNANGDLDAEISVFANTARAIDDPELFSRLVASTLDNAQDDATRTRYTSYAAMLEEGESEDTVAKLEGLKTVQNALKKPKKLTVASIADSESFQSMHYDAAYKMFKEPAVDGQSLFLSAYANAKTIADKAEAIKSLSNLFQDRDYTNGLTSSYLETLGEDSDFERTMTSRTKLLTNMAYDSDVSDNDYAHMVKVLTSIDDAKKKGSQIALRDVLKSSAYKALPSEYTKLFTSGDTSDNITAAVLEMTKDNAVQEAELISDIIASTKGGSEAYAQIGDLLSHSRSSEQTERLAQYRDSMFSQVVKLDDGQTVDPTQISRVVKDDYYYTVYGKDGDRISRIYEDYDATKKLLKSENLLYVGRGSYYAKDEVGYVSYNAKQGEVEIFHASHSDDKPVFSTYEMDQYDAERYINALVREGGFVSLPQDKQNALNIARIEAVQYNADKKTLSLETLTGSPVMKKVSREDATPVLRILTQSDEFFCDDDRRTFIRKDTANVIAVKSSKNTISVSGENKKYTLKNVSTSSCIDIDHLAKYNDNFTEDDKGNYVKPSASAMVAYNDLREELIMAFSKDEKYTKTMSSATRAQNVITDLVGTDSFVWRDSLSASNIDRVESVELDDVMDTYTVNLTSGQSTTLDGVSSSNLRAFEKVLEDNKHFTKTGSGEFEVTKRDDVKPLIVPKSSLSAQFNAASIVEVLVEKTSVERVQKAIDAAAAWLNTSHASEVEDSSNPKMQALGALLASAYSLHADIPETISAPANDTKPKKPHVKLDTKKDALSQLQAAFNTASHGETMIEETVQVERNTANHLAADNAIMQYYQIELDKLACK